MSPSEAAGTSLRLSVLQMVWENGCVVIVMLTPLVENGVKQCYHYWPDEGSNLYHIYEVTPPPLPPSHTLLVLSPEGWETTSGHCWCSPAGEPGVRTHLVR